MSIATDDGSLFALAPMWDEPLQARPVGVETARAWLPRYHYSGDIGHTGAHFYGTFAPDLLAVVGIAPATNAYGLTRRFSLEQWNGNKEISRVAVHPDAPTNTASRSIAAVSHLLRRRGVEWVFAYADSGQHHHGGIYQALNAVYVGVNVGGPPPPSWEIYEDGQWSEVAARTLQRKCGTGRGGAVERLAAKGVQVRMTAKQKPDKHTYILPTGGPAVNRAIRKHLAQHALPYPKRSS